MSSRICSLKSSRPSPKRGLIVLFAAIALVSSCSSRYDIALHADGSADLSISASLAPQTTRLVTNLAGFDSGSDGVSSSDPLLDAADLSASLRASPGVAAVSLRNPDARSVAGTVAVSDLERFLTTPASDGSMPASGAIRIDRSASGGRLSIAIDRASGSALLATVSPDIGDYVSALMAPVATGENLGRAEYLALVKSMYGNGIASEIEAAKVRASIELPGPAVSAKGGSIDGRRVDFVLPLVDLLVLEKPINLEVSWK